MILNFFKLHEDVQIPKFATQQSACFDLAYNPAGKQTVTVYRENLSHDNRAISPSGVIAIAPGERALLPTGLIADIPKGYSLRVHIRSSMALKQGLTLSNSEGVVDSDYVDELFLMITNHSTIVQTFSPGTRIAQGELVSKLDYGIYETIDRPGKKTDRTGGFGSTGFIQLSDEKNPMDAVIQTKKAAKKKEVKDGV